MNPLLLWLHLEVLPYVWNSKGIFILCSTDFPVRDSWFSPLAPSEIWDQFTQCDQALAVDVGGGEYCF